MTLIISQSFLFNIVIIMTYYYQQSTSFTADSEIVGKEASLPLGNITFCFNYTLKSFGNILGILIVAVLQVEFLPFLVCTRHELLNSPWSPLSDSPLHDAPYIFNRRQIWTAVRPVKHTHYMPTKPRNYEAE